MQSLDRLRCMLLCQSRWLGASSSSSRWARALRKSGLRSRAACRRQHDGAICKTLQIGSTLADLGGKLLRLAGLFHDSIFSEVRASSKPGAVHFAMPRNSYRRRSHRAGGRIVPGADAVSGAVRASPGHAGTRPGVSGGRSPDGGTIAVSRPDRGRFMENQFGSGWPHRADAG